MGHRAPWPWPPGLIRCVTALGPSSSLGVCWQDPQCHRPASGAPAGALAGSGSPTGQGPAGRAGTRPATCVPWAAPGDTGRAAACSHLHRPCLGGTVPSSAAVSRLTEGASSLHSSVFNVGGGELLKRRPRGAPNGSQILGGPLRLESVGERKGAFSFRVTGLASGRPGPTQVELRVGPTSRTYLRQNLPLSSLCQRR